jgi:uncharacterized glyoxalase superfamily protein PhnB
MTDQRDPFDALRQRDGGARPDPAFVARLRRQVVAALTGTDDPADVPVVDLDVPRPHSRPVRSALPATASSVLVPYLCVSGATDAIEWYSSVLGAVEVVRYTADDGRIGHAELTIGSARFYLSDDYPEIGVAAPGSLGGTSVSLHLDVADVDAMHAAAIAAGATDDRPPADQPYGARAAIIVDPFGHRWMLQTTIATPTLAEINAAMDGFTVTAAAAGEPAEPEPIEPEPIELGYFTLTATDTDRAARFYGALFGWSTEAGNLGDSYRHVNNTQLPLGIVPGASGDPPTLYFRVPDVAEYAARVRLLGGEVVNEGDWESGPGAECRDDQGGTFHLWQAAPGY